MSTSSSRFSTVWQYVGTIAITLAALAIAMFTQRISATPSYVAFVAAVALAARYGGKGPAFLASTLSLLLVDYFMIPPIGVIDFQQPEQGVNVIVFGAVAITITSMTTRLRRAEHEARDRAASLARLANGALRLQAATEALSKASSVADVRRVSGEAIGSLTTISDDATDAERSLARLYEHAVASALVRAERFDAERGGREAAETLARAREEVLAVVAHDLRNPLTLVGTSTEMLVEFGDDVTRRREMLDIVRRSVKRMNTMIGDLLDITRLQAGHLQLESSSVVAADLLAQVAQAWTPVLAERDIALTVVIPRSDVRVQADAGRVAQVLDNLIGNAGKFTPAGGRVCVRAERDASNQVRFSVSDNGPGLAPEALARLFDRFWQARRADRRGIGLGLTICKGIVEAHGGRIWCESAPGAGTKFFFTLPPATSIEAQPMSA